MKKGRCRKNKCASRVQVAADMPEFIDALYIVESFLACVLKLKREP